MSEQNISKIRTLNNSVYNIRDSVLRSIVDVDDSTSGIPQQPSDTHIATTKARQIADGITSAFRCCISRI